jgi:hypothetical protein
MVSSTLLAVAGLVGALVAMMVDGRRAVTIAAAALGAGLLPTAAVLGVGFAVPLLAGSVVAAVAAAWIARRVAMHLPWVAGLDPLVPAFAPARQLFGPRSARATAAALAVPAASWISFNVPFGQTTTVTAVLFPMAYAWICGGLRLVVARTVEDIIVGGVMMAMATASTWLLRGGGDAAVAAAAAAVVPLASGIAGWLAGRHQRRPAMTGDPA